MVSRNYFASGKKIESINRCTETKKKFVSLSVMDRMFVPPRIHVFKSPPPG